MSQQGDSIILQTLLTEKDRIIASADQQLKLYEAGWVRFRIAHIAGKLWRLSRVPNGSIAA